jgi:hypothetical protein
MSLEVRDASSSSSTRVDAAAILARLESGMSLLTSIAFRLAHSPARIPS